MALTDVPSTTRRAPRIEPLLSSRLFMAPQLAGDRLYFISNLGGRFSLYVMDRTGSVPEPLLPPDIALQNPELIGGHSFYVFPSRGQIVVMIDNDGDENYQPMIVPLDGGLPERAFEGAFAAYRGHLVHCDPDRNILYLSAESREEALNIGFEANLATGEIVKLAESKWGGFPGAANKDGSKVVIWEQYTFGDVVLDLWERGHEGLRRLYGTGIEDQPDRSQVAPNGVNAGEFTADGNGLILQSAVFEDTYSLGYLDGPAPGELRPIRVTGTVHGGNGEMDSFSALKDDRYTVGYNIDGVSWVYEATFDRDTLEMRVDHVLVGEGSLTNGTLEHLGYDPDSDSFAVSFSTATTPTQLFVIEGPDRSARQVTRERILGTPQEMLSPGEDASFESYDGLRVSARLYLPSEATGHTGPFPLVYYIHGGPQGQERPNFAWFSMPLIQFLTLNGFAVFVPNVRGSTGYGQRYMKYVDHDWGGQDRLDHVHAMTQVLPKDSRIDVKRAGVIGRSYGGYMTLTLASRHPDLWAGAVDMFGPYNLITFSERLPATWKPYFAIVLGDPENEQEREFLLERSPYTYIDNVSCPLFVIQGKNDPRVVERESRDVVERLQANGKEVDYLVFENEGHDVIKYENKVICYTAIADFFKRTL